MKHIRNMELLESALDSLLARPIAYHRAFVDVTGSITAGLLLSQAWYWNRTKENNPDRSFYKTREEWAEETGLNLKAVDAARRVLRAKGFITEKRQGNPSKMYYTLNKTKLTEAILEGARARKSHVTKLVSYQIGKLPKREVPSAQIGNSLYTESTTENSVNQSVSQEKQFFETGEKTFDPVKEVERAFGNTPFETPGASRVRSMVKDRVITREWITAFVYAKRIYDADRLSWKGKAYIPVAPPLLLKNYELTRKGVEVVITSEVERIGILLGDPEEWVEAINGKILPEGAPAWVRLVYCHKRGYAESCGQYREEALSELFYRPDWLKHPGIELTDAEIKQLFNIDYTTVWPQRQARLDALEVHFHELSDLLAFVTTP